MGFLSLAVLVGFLLELGFTFFLSDSIELGKFALLLLLLLLVLLRLFVEDRVIEAKCVPSLAVVLLSLLSTISISFVLIIVVGLLRLVDIALSEHGIVKLHC